MTLQEGVFPSLVVLWNQERLSSVAGGPVSTLLLSLLQALPANVASSLLPTGEVSVASMPHHWQVLSTQPCMLNPAAFQDAVISSNFKVPTSQFLESLQTAARHSSLNHQTQISCLRSPLIYVNFHSIACATHMSFAA